MGVLGKTKMSVEVVKLKTTKDTNSITLNSYTQNAWYVWVITITRDKDQRTKMINMMNVFWSEDKVKIKRKEDVMG